MPEHPAELPAEGEGGSGRIDWSRVRGGIGGPAELPAVDRISISQLVNEVFRLRDRMNAVENSMLAAKISGSARFAVGGPQELPEGEGGGGGGVGPIHEIHEIHEIAELPVSRLVQELASLNSRFVSFERQVLQQLNALSQQLGKA